jgi:hypothetical protein
LRATWHFFAHLFKSFLAALQQSLRWCGVNHVFTLSSSACPHRLDAKGIMMLARCVAGLVLLALLPGTARADGANCAPRDRVVVRLAESYGERRRSVGLGPGNRVVEVYASDDTGSWTITITMPGGLTCLVASGHAFEQLAKVPPRPGGDA